MDHNITADLRFSIIPEWVLDAPISDRAHRVYAILARYADNETLQAFPSRETLAKRAHCNAKAITKAINELVAIGAVTKQHRRQGESYQSNIYTLRRVGPILTPPRVNFDTGVGSDLTPPRVSDDLLTITTELEPVELEPLNTIESNFAEWWTVYPRKTGKPSALRAYKKALKKVSAELLLEKAVELRDQPGRVEKYTPYPASWLNDERWEDETVVVLSESERLRAEALAEMERDSDVGV